VAGVSARNKPAAADWTIVVVDTLKNAI